jgi:phosphoribosyl 1,2-cyclic phosphate phosphodiesterase
MKIQLLGTGGADGVPALYGDTRVSRFARANGGKDVRSRTAALIDGILKIDFGPDTWHQMTREGLDARDWTALLFTHSDADHFALDEIQYAVFPFNDYEYVGFQVYGNSVICRAIIERFPEWPFEVFMTESFQSFENSGYTITPIEANHTAGEDSHNLIFESDGKTFLYGSDTGIWPDVTWEKLKDFKLDGMVIECTEGFAPTSYYGHLDAKEVLEVVERLNKMGTVSSDTKIWTTHHSHQGEATHDELVEFFGPHNINVGYDGAVIEIA